MCEFLSLRSIMICWALVICGVTSLGLVATYIGTTGNIL